jgi:hypothetical protein
VRRFRGASKAPLAVGGILALPVFFLGLMAFSLELDKPSHHLTKKGALALGDPTKGTIGAVYLAAFAVSAAVVLVGLLAMLLRSRLGAVVPALAAIAAATLLLLPLGKWEALHTKRYALGIDNIRDPTASRPSPQNIWLQGEWEQSARTTAHQVGLVTIGIAIAAILISVALEIRRRRGIEGPPVPPPPGVSGAPEVSPALELEQADSDLVRGDRPGRWRW